MQLLKDTKITKKIKGYLIVLSSLLLINFVGAYQQQGFSQYQENLGKINFLCSSQCITLIDGIKDKEYLSLKGDIQGKGIIGYGFLVGEQLIPGEMINFTSPNLSKVDQKFFFANAQVFSQIPKNSNIAIIMQGNFQGSFEPNLKNLSFGEKVSQGRKDFWKMETLTPYSINLRYGVKIGGTSIIKYGYILFFIIGLFILIFTKNKRKHIFFLGLGFFLVIGIRNLITYIHITHQGIISYTQQNNNDKRFFDLGDYISFTNKIRKKLNLDNIHTINKENIKLKKIFINSFQDRPFKGHWNALYLSPSTIVLTGSEADYIVYYKKDIPKTTKQENIIINFNGSYLLKNK